MSRDYRYEIKFIANDIQLAEFYSWMWACTSMEKAYPERVVNSLYFDDSEFQAVRDNLAGLPNRDKFRFRWYGAGPDSGAEGLRLEKKTREGRLGYKTFRLLPRLEDRLFSTAPGELAAASRDEFVELGLLDGTLLPDVRPTLHVSYLRHYFQDIDGIRITVDSEIEFYSLDGAAALYQTRPISFSKKIIEIKFPPQAKDTAAQLIKSLHLVPKRCSKYLQGLSMNGVAVYI